LRTVESLFGGLLAWGSVLTWVRQKGPEDGYTVGKPVRRRLNGCKEMYRRGLVSVAPKKDPLGYVGDLPLSYLAEGEAIRRQHALVVWGRVSWGYGGLFRDNISRKEKEKREEDLKNCRPTRGPAQWIASWLQ